jgi:hypothetical protein
VFSTKYLLTQHQTKTKYCLSIQGTNIKQNECKYCSKNLCSNERLNTHYEVCKEKLKKDSQDMQENIRKEYESKLLKQKRDFESKLKEQRENYEEKMRSQKEVYDTKINDNLSIISKLETKLEKFENVVIANSTKHSNTTNTTNTTNITLNENNTLNLNDIEKMNSFLDEKLDKDVLAGGQKSFALLMSSTILKDKYKCVDPSRQNFEFTNELGEIERDVKAKKLTTAIIKSNIRGRSGEKGEELWKKEDGSTDSLRFQANSKNVLEMINFDMDNSTFRSELSALT